MRRRNALLGLPFLMGAAETAPPSRNTEYVLVHIDTETTGLNPGYHELIDIGAIYTDMAGRELGRWYRRLMPKYPERIDPGAQKVNGFDAALWRREGAWTPEAALADWIAYEDKQFGSKPRLRISYNCGFDKGFLDALYRSCGREWSEAYTYFWFDLPSMAWALGYRQIRGPWVAEALGVQDEPHGGIDHTGITGAEVNLRIYRKLIQQKK